MSNQKESTNTSTTVKVDLPGALHVAATADSTDLRAFGAMAAAALLFRNIDWTEFRKDPQFQKYVELFQQLHDDIGNSLKSGFGHSDVGAVDGDDSAKGGAA